MMMNPHQYGFAIIWFVIFQCGVSNRRYLIFHRCHHCVHVLRDIIYVSKSLHVLPFNVLHCLVTKVRTCTREPCGSFLTHGRIPTGWMPFLMPPVAFQ